MTPVAQQPIRFDDGAAYERLMGAWSQLVGQVFLDWLSPAAGQRWIDVGCGNGAFTELLMRRCAPVEVRGIDPSEGQLAFARTRAGATGAVFSQGDAMALPFDAGRFDAAVMALVIHFVPDPARAIKEMVRVVRPGGLVATYVWDAFGEGSPTDPILTEMRAMGLTPGLPPSLHASTMDALHGLWRGAGLDRIASRAITVRRSFDDADDYWEAISGTGVPKAMLDRMEADAVATLKDRVRALVSTDGQKQITLEARANAIMGHVPGAP
jgi:ubiquinone/menaquinone biosynthesis C-methylase UbiE